MAEHHERYEQLAVGHVLGGLGSAESRDFRSHLLDCADCRTRVAELRDIATDLEAAERDERARARLRTELPPRADPEDQPPAPSNRITIRHVTLAAVVVLLLAGAMAFWNLHLRTNLSARTSVAEAHADTLRHLARGVPVAATFAEGLTGYVATDGDRLAVTMAGVADVEPGQTLVLWVLDGEGQVTDDSALLARPGALDGGLLAGVTPLADDGAVAIITREMGPPGVAPIGEQLMRAELPREADGA